MLNEQMVESMLREFYVDLERSESYEERNEIFASYAKRIADADDSAVISITQAAEMLGLTRQRVHALLLNRQLDGFKVGNSWVICKSSVEERMK